MNVKIATNQFKVTNADGTPLSGEQWELHGGAIQQSIANGVLAGLNGVDGVSIESGDLEVTVTVDRVIEDSETYAGRA